MTTEIAGAATTAAPERKGGGRRARLGELAPFLPAAVLLAVLFFVPLAVMFVFSFWETDFSLDIVPNWNLTTTRRSSGARPTSGRWGRRCSWAPALPSSV